MTETPTAPPEPASQGATVSPPNPTAALTSAPTEEGTAVVFQPLVQGEEETAIAGGRDIRPSLFLAIGAVALMLAGGLLVFIRRQF